MKNIIPKSEGSVTEADMELVKKEILDVLKPLFDGFDALADLQTMILEAIQGAPVIQSLPEGTRQKAIMAAIASLGADAAMDLIIIYPEEEV